MFPGAGPRARRCRPRDGSRAPHTRRGPVGRLHVGRARDRSRAELSEPAPSRRRRPRQPARVPACRARLGGSEHAARPHDALPGGTRDRVAQRRPAARRGLPEPGQGRGRVSAATATAPRRAPGLVARLDELLGREVSLRALQVLRVLAGPIVLLHLAPFLSDSLHGRTYQDVFHEPYASWYPELPEGGYIAVLWIGAASAVAMTVGALAHRPALARVATVATFAIV